jgi:DNA-binding IclR family transcriptional regulator
MTGRYQKWALRVNPENGFEGLRGVGEAGGPGKGRFSSPPGLLSETAKPVTLSGEFHMVKLAAGQKKPGYHVRVVDRVFAILEELADGSAKFGDVALAERLGLHKSTVHRLLAVMQHHGFVEREPGSTKYRLGWRIFELGMAAASHLDILERAKPYVVQLVETTGETAHLGVLRQGEVVSLVNVESRYTVRTPATVGRRIPLHCTSQGKAILAFLPPGQVARRLKGYVFSRHSANTIVSNERFLEDLALVAGRGYAVDNEEYEEGLRCIAAPVHDHTGEVAGAIGIAGPTFRVTGARLPALSREVRRAAAELSAALGYRGAAAPRRSGRQAARISDELAHRVDGGPH